MFLGNPPVPMPCSPTPAGPEPPGVAVAGRGPRLVAHRGLQPRVRQSRGSIARPEHSLSTLRPRRHHRGRKTRFRRRARLYRVGLVTHRVPMKGFRDAVVTSLPPFPSFHGASHPCQMSPLSRSQPLPRGGSATGNEPPKRMGPRKPGLVAGLRKFVSRSLTHPPRLGGRVAAVTASRVSGSGAPGAVLVRTFCARGRGRKRTVASDFPSKWFAPPGFPHPPPQLV
jgi:hypothetical protein